MSANVKKRLEEALEVGHKIANEKKSKEPLKLNIQKNIHLGDENGIYAIALNHNGSRAAVGLGTGIMQLYDCQKWEQLRKMRTSLITNLPLLAIKFHPCQTSNTVSTGGSDGVIKVWNLDSFTHGETLNESGNQITALDFNSTGHYFASGGKDCTIRVYDSEVMKLLRQYNGTNKLDIDSVEDVSLIPGHSKKVFAVKSHPDDSNIFLSASWDHTLKIWDIRSEYAVKTIYGPFVCGDALDVLHNNILTASWQAKNALQIWDYRNGSLINTIPFPTNDRNGEYLYCARFYDEKHIIAGGSGSNDMKIINMNIQKVIGNVSGNNRPIQAVEVMEKKRMFVCGTSGNLLRICTFS